ncbi:hypothetical protein SDC9_129806 [bioreactor metagenome]|uniref:HTH cro/C1-type domain-containing protein n=1 Tax=bioreactor metagenome TaxID=1076179 RepID=A0A645D0J8_9ZZZZ
MNTKYENNRTELKDMIRERVQKLCREKGISQTELGKRIGISKSTMSDNLKSDMRLSTIQKIANALEINLIDLLK